MGQSLLHAAARAASLAQGPDLLELWRVADRVARHAEVRLAHGAPELLDPAAAHPARAEAIVLRQRANDLLRAALGAESPARALARTAPSLRG